MSFPRYKEYQDSGLNWLGQIPTHWRLKRLGFFFGERREKVSDRDYQALSVTKDGIVPQLETAAKTDDRDNRKKVCQGDFVINSRSDRKGSAGLSELDGSVSLISTVLKPKESVHGPYVHHLLRSIPFQEEFYRFGKGIVADLWSTNYSSMSGITLAMPPLREQMAIASFLDRETAKIDDLIAQQEKLIELLQEKRQAVISHAVTKGLNPSAPMKDSGVEWLGEMPEHWIATPLKHCLRVIDCKHLTAEFIDDGIPVASIGEVQGRWVNLENAKETTENFYQQLTGGDRTPNPGDLIFSRNATVGEVAEVSSDLPRFAVGQDVVIMKPSRQISSYFCWITLRSETTRKQLDLAMIGSTFKRINVERIKSIVIALPPLQEQQEIERHIQAISGHYEALSNAAEKHAKLLQERRSALISAAVTGQIDVRGLVSKEEVAV